MVFYRYFNLTKKSNLIGWLEYDFIRFFLDNLVVAYFMDPLVDGKCLMDERSLILEIYIIIYYVNRTTEINKKQLIDAQKLNNEVNGGNAE